MTSNIGLIIVDDQGKPLTRDDLNQHHICDHCHFEVEFVFLFDGLTIEERQRGLKGLSAPWKFYCADCYKKLLQSIRCQRSDD